MSILNTPPQLNPSNPLTGITQKVNENVNVKNLAPSNLEPDKNVAGIKYKKPLIECAKFPLLSLDKIPCPMPIEASQVPLASKQILVDRGVGFLKENTKLPIPTDIGISTEVKVPTPNIPKLEIAKLPTVPCSAVPSLSALNPFPEYKEKIKTWLGEPITLPKIKDLLPNLPNIPKPPYFTLPCPKKSNNLNDKG